ncbi:hypothetical protein RSSM_00429 [Rhodopirellula sallentina SM41]|uniref:Uncharacterized protein n=1 Tax=Rhodopirellula sallentina SM41 TaxID=1263870 RepID=M5UA03_9BACT|nr:hypothetical protein RSSM_00429 [Rhodopirellula sallentina SM41]
MLRLLLQTMFRTPLVEERKTDRRINSEAQLQLRYASEHVSLSSFDPIDFLPRALRVGERLMGCSRDNPASKNRDQEPAIV